MKKNILKISSLLLISIIFACTNSSKNSEIKNSENEVGENEEIIEETMLNYDDFNIAFIMSSRLYLYDVKTDDLIDFDWETDTVFNCVFSDDNQILYYTVSKNSKLIIKKADLSDTKPEISILAHLGKETQEFVTETFGEKSPLYLYNNHLILRCDFSWNEYGFTKFLEYSIENNTQKTLDFNQFAYKYGEYRESNEPNKDYNYIYKKTKELDFSIYEPDAEVSDFYFGGVSKDESKIFFAAVLGWGDYPHGPYIISNIDGSKMKILENTDMATNDMKPIWYGNNLIYISYRFVDDYTKSQQFRYTKADNNESRFIAESVDYYAVKNSD